MTGRSLPAVLKLVKDLGDACEQYHDEHVREVQARHVQTDEIWSFIFGKDKNLPEDKRGTFGYGSVWTWTALDSDSKLIISWLVGTRDAGCALELMQDLAGRVANRIQLTTDGHRAYLEGVEGAFGSAIDYGMLIKLYGATQESETRYSPAECIGTRTQVITGDPDPDHISTSHVERSNLSIRMATKRFARLTNAHSKKLANHKAALALYFLHYNFARIHMTLRVTPAMAAGLSDHVWSLEEIVSLLDKK